MTAPEPASWRQRLRPVRMTRVALVAPEDALDAILAEVGSAGVVELEPVDPGAGPDAGDAAAMDFDRMRAAALHRHGAAAYLGWCPEPARRALSHRLAPLGGALATLPPPPGAEPPTLLAPSGRVSRSFAPIVETYGAVPYADVDPTLPAGVAYMVMFGMMFGDAGHGLVLVLAAAVLARHPPRRYPRLRDAWPFVAGAGLASTVFGVLYGEFFGPTGLLPALWLRPLAEPVRLLVAAVGLGGALLAVAYVVGIVNRWREGSAALALYAPSGIAGAAVFAGLGLLAAGVFAASIPLVAVAVAVAAAGLMVAAAGLYTAAGGGGAAVAQTVVQLFDLVIRICANLVSFARLAAFGLTHAALGALVWAGTTALWQRGGTWTVAAVVVFALGNALAFGLEAVVAGVQALRLEYYELFSRVFEGTGRPFRPWRCVPATKEVQR
ncbi:V-type ATPase 116kDa subunit family protein [Dactylosporangium sp. NPDC000244]|uniref:V-type ATPase 116kDa subunit family protein n=1 Tax=Dactylosporangium sp. NPDC000244 TaxID=3154365 RepID=UPI00332A0067